MVALVCFGHRRPCKITLANIQILTPTSTCSLYKRTSHNIGSLLICYNRRSSSTKSCSKDATNLPLSGLRVLDLSRVLAGPFCSQILADYGASVTKVEQPGIGDETRQWRTTNEGQMWKDEHPLMSLYYTAINRNKRSMTLNLKHPAAIKIARELSRESDVLIHNFVPGTIEKMGLGYEDLRRDNERLIYASVSGYGTSGPLRSRAGYDAIAQAEAGLLHITGESNGPPTKAGIAIIDLCTGLFSHGAILTALEQRHKTGLGTKIEGSLFETSLSLLINVGLAALNLDTGPGAARRKGARFGLGHPNLVPYGGFGTRDKKVVFLAANNNRQWQILCNKMKLEHLTEDPRFATNDGRVENRAEINGILQRELDQKTKEEVLNMLEGSGLPYGSINDVVEAVEHPQAEARKMVLEVEDFEAARDGVLKLLAPAVKFSGTDVSQVRLNPPLLGEHTDQVLSELGYTSAQVADLRKSGAV